MVSDSKRVMGSQMSSPDCNIFDEKYEYASFNNSRAQPEVQPKASGGPLDLGDPDDRSLSEEEVKILIPRSLWEM